MQRESNGFDALAAKSMSDVDCQDEGGTSLDNVRSRRASMLARREGENVLGSLHALNRKCSNKNSERAYALSECEGVGFVESCMRCEEMKEKFKLKFEKDSSRDIKYKNKNVLFNR